MNHKVEDVLIAILEGITFALQDSLRKTPAIDEKVKKVILSGGLVRLPVLPQIVSNVFNRPVFLSRYLDTASVGAFFLAMRAMGRDYGDILEGGYGMACLPEDVYVQYYRRVYDLYQSFLDVILSFALQTSAYFKEET